MGLYDGTRVYEVICVCSDNRFKLPTWAEGFTCRGLAMARTLVKQDVRRALDMNVNKGALEVFQGSHGASISHRGVEVLRWEIRFTGRYRYV